MQRQQNVILQLYGRQSGKSLAADIVRAIERGDKLAEHHEHYLRQYYAILGGPQDAIENDYWPSAQVHLYQQCVKEHTINSPFILERKPMKNDELVKIKKQREQFKEINVRVIENGYLVKAFDRVLLKRPDPFECPPRCKTFVFRDAGSLSKFVSTRVSPPAE